MGTGVKGVVDGLLFFGGRSSDLGPEFPYRVSSQILVQVKCSFEQNSVNGVNAGRFV